MAWTPPGAGELTDRVRFEHRPAGPGDGLGNFENEWATFCPSRRVRLQAQRGGEDVQAARLTGTDNWTLDVPADAIIRKLTTDMRVVDARDEARVWNIRWIGNLQGGGHDRWRTLTMERSVAT